jgi:hypothetical protein
MGGSSSKKPFTEWDLIEFSNMAGELFNNLFYLNNYLLNLGVPLATVEKIYKDFKAATGVHNRMDKNEFRRLYKEMYMNGQSGNNAAPFITDHDLDKMSDHVFEDYDFDGSGLNQFYFYYFNYYLFFRKINF